VTLALDTIHQGDCLAGLAQVPEGTVDLAFADPPFNIGYEYDVYDDNKHSAAYLDWTRQWMMGVCRALKPSGTFWVAIGDEYAAEIKLIAQNDLGLTCRSWVIWYYTFGVHCTRKFTRSHAHLFYFVKDPARITFNEDEISVPSARQLVYADRRAEPSGRMPDDTWVLRPQDVPAGFEATGDTWYFPRVAGTFKERSGFHGCQMPEQLLGRIIRACSNPGELVLDPFTGSGTTLVTAKKLGRHWLGFELSEEYVRRAGNRIDQAHVGQGLEGAPEPVMSAPRTPGKASKVWLRAGVTRALAEAFLAAADGWSSHRVIADPELNARFQAECRDFGLPGKPADWNQALLRLRREGRLRGLPKARRTHISAAEQDPYLFASEIALRRRADATGLSLDDILCDPEETKRFDALARAFAPGYSPLEYRYAALALRKRAPACRVWSRLLPRALLRIEAEFRPLEDWARKPLAGRPGVYLIRLGDERILYAGETADLGRFFQQQLQAEGWHEHRDGLVVGVIAPSDMTFENRQGLKSRMIAQHVPDWNVLELGRQHKPRRRAATLFA
jgi:DNA modification methylase